MSIDISKKLNTLEVELGLKEKSPIELFYENPCESTLHNISKRIQTQEMVQLAVENDGMAIRAVSKKLITKDLCETAVRQNRHALSCIPKQILENFPYLKNIAAEQDNTSFQNNRLFEQKKKYADLFMLTRHSPQDTDSCLQEECLPIYIQFDKAETPPPANETVLVKVDNNSAHTYNLAIFEDIAVHQVYYITDLHLEHQLKGVLVNGKFDKDKINAFLDKKIHELLSSIQGKHEYLLIGGDVGHTKDLVTLFYQKLISTWEGTIISVLGNHELWDDHPEGIISGYISRPLSEIIDDYRSRIRIKKWESQSILLQNEVFINYKNIKPTVISEEQILNATDDDLRDILSKSTFILLGGIGFSGLNPKYNANIGLYRSAVPTIEEDVALSYRFKSVYDKLHRCASDMQVIVLTHAPVSNWTNDPFNPNWVYINGHTHQNSLIRKQNGTTVLSDNQVGYTPSKWKLNSFTIAGWYDPFRNMEDGIYEITSDEFKEFNLGRGIQTNGCKYDGTIYALKKNGYYMFLLRSACSLCLLVGGQRKKLKNTNIKYYYDNMEQYALRVKKAITPYQNAIKAIAKEIEIIGGFGTVHGCIVDIDWLNHIYLNPCDGKVTPYFAYDVASRKVYPDLPSLIKDQLPNLRGKFIAAKNEKMIPLLCQYAVSSNKNNEQTSLATVPQLVLGKEMYAPSHIMKSLQYVFDNKVIRIWDDEILSADFGEETSFRSIEDKRTND